MKNLVVANWKLNPATREEAKDLFEKIKNGLAAASAEGSGEPKEVVVCPPFVYLSGFRVQGLGFSLGAQNVFYEEKGAFTGEISPAMLKDLEVEYVIIGHSERRKYFNETDEIVNKKIKKSLEAGLKIVFCVGETAEEREAGKENEVLERQIKIGLSGISNFKFQISNLNVAYEPVWAIGTGNNCSVEETKQTISFIKELFARHNAAALGGEVRVLYGGSVKSENSGAYVKEAGANGLLVGGASLNAEEFVKIVKSAG